MKLKWTSYRDGGETHYLANPYFKIRPFRQLNVVGPPKRNGFFLTDLRKFQNISGLFPTAKAAKAAAERSIADVISACDVIYDPTR